MWLAPRTAAAIWQPSSRRAIIKGCDRPHGEVPKWSYRDRLESDLSRKRHVGSNPTLSAIFLINVCRCNNLQVSCQSDPSFVPTLWLVLAPAAARAAFLRRPLLQVTAGIVFGGVLTFAIARLIEIKLGFHRS